MREPERHSASFLLADCGSTSITVALFGLVEGSYRLIARAMAPATHKAPWHDILLGIQDATERISEVTGWPLLTDDGDIIMPQQQSGAGVDYFGVTVSAAKPLRVFVTGLLEDVSVASARHAIESIYAQEVGAFTLDSAQNAEQQIQAVLESKPELIFISGGTDESSSEQLLQLLEVLELGAGLLQGMRQPDIIYAGNRRLREYVTTTFGPSGTLYVADNVRPSIDVEQLGDARQALAEIYQDRKVGALPGFQQLEAAVNLQIEPTARAFGTMIDYFGALYRSQVLGVDLGSNNIVMAASSEGGQGRLFVRSNLGLGAPLPELLNLVDLEEILRWTPEAFSEAELSDLIYNRSINPQTIAVTEEEIHLEQALARALLRQALEEAGSSWGWTKPGAPIMPSAGLIVLCGNALAAAPRPGQALLTVLDALQPTGVFSVAVDRDGVLPMLGLLAKEEPAAAVQILEGGALFELGWVIAPAGAGVPGERAIRITVESEDKGEYRIDAEFGELIAVPLAPNASAKLSLKPERKVDIGRGPGRGRKITVHGGAVGLVVDVRGRPLLLPQDDEERRNRVRQWHWDMGG